MAVLERPTDDKQRAGNNSQYFNFIYFDQPKFLNQNKNKTGKTIKLLPKSKVIRFGYFKTSIQKNPESQILVLTVLKTFDESGFPYTITA